MNMESGPMAAGDARCPAISTQDIIARDKVAAPGWVRSESYAFLGSEDVSTDRYIDPDFARREMDSLWTRSWLSAERHP